MQDLWRDLQVAFRTVLEGNYRERAQGVPRFFDRDVRFQHLLFKTRGRDNAWGVYQLWSFNNLGIDCDFLEIFCDDRHPSVLLDVLEHCHIWWWPPFHQDVKIHTILDLCDSPRGKVINYQWDYIIISETVLYHMLPWLGAFAKRYVLPVNGAVVSCLGLIFHAIRNRAAQGLLDQKTTTKKKQSGAAMPLLLEPKDVAEAVGVLYQCSPAQRFAIVHCACAEDAEYYSTWSTVVGPDMIFGVLNFWATVNRKIEIKVMRVVPSGNRILVDAEQTWTPYLWPTFLMHPPVWFHHILISTKDNPAGGKLVTKVDNIILMVEPFLKYQVGLPYEAWRALNGRIYAVAGRAIYKILDWWNTKQVGHRVAAEVRSLVPHNVRAFLERLKCTCADAH